MKNSTREALDRWAKDGIPPGGFLTACLQDKFIDAVCKADEENLRDIEEIARYIFSELPASCWGTREKMMAWNAKRIPVEQRPE